MDISLPNFMGHGHCYLWRSDLLILHIGSDVLITLAYFSIPFALGVLLHKRQDLEYRWVFVLFILFIFACGATHLMNVWNVWHGDYYLSGAVKLVTAVASVLTAVLIWPLLPKLLSLPSPSAMVEANTGLRLEIDRREASESRLENARRELEQNVKELTETKEKLEREARARQKLEQQLKDNNDILSESNQELEQFAFVASHDLREPLRKLLSFTQFLNSGRYGQLDEKGTEFVGYIRDSATRMEALLDSLLQYSRVSSRSLTMEPVDLNTVVEEVKGDLQLAIEENGAILEVGPLAEVRGDRSQLWQLIQNLVSNSLKYRKEDEAPRINITGTTSESGYFDLEISDNGIGFDMTYHEQIFEIFKRLHGKGEYGGTGMGLTICRKIVERHKGQIDVESEPGRGTRFRISLPLADDGGELLA